MAQEMRSHPVDGRVAGSDQGVRAATTLLRLGKLGQCGEESLVIEAASPSGFSWADCCSTAASTPKCADLQDEAESCLPVVEQDLLLEDCGPEDEVRLPECLPPPWAPGSQAARALMRARAQQCVVCMEEKEHTFVPPHAVEGTGPQVVGHRFCTDCWAEFLQHNSRRQRHSFLLPQLACPLCRSGISVPDAWGVGFELPAKWMQAPEVHVAADGAEAEEESASCPVEAEALHLWAQAPPPTPASASSEASASSSGKSSPTGVPPRRDSFASTSSWPSLSCPAPASWPPAGRLSGCLSRFSETILASTDLDTGACRL